MRTALRRFSALATAIILAPAAFACLWDYDTLRQEAQGAPGVVETITGFFETYPPVYYERRIEIATEVVANNPDDLDAYDALAVACDRLGRGDEALGWLARKADAMERSGLAPDHDHRYRYHANLGTVHVHNWIRAGASRDDLQDLERGRDHIATAIEINPDAHFGREQYQLYAIEWLLASAEQIFDPTERPWSRYVGPVLLVMDDSAADYLSRTNVEHRSSVAPVVEGLGGLVTLGDAWRSLDVFLALSTALSSKGDSTLAYMAALRCRELVDEGARTLRPDVWAEYEVDSPLEVVIGTEHRLEHPEPAEHYFRTARSAADAWQAEFHTFIEQRIAEGLHPDSHEDFWTGAPEPVAPEQPAVGLEKPANRVAAIASGAAILAGFGLLITRIKRKPA